MNGPKISVILPIFNGERYMRESIDSVLAQTFADYELIIWDDCSNDNSRAIIAGYRDPRIRVFINAANKGIFKTVNLAIGQARGELIRFWSWDDIMRPHCLRVECEFHAKHPEIGMSYCARDIIDESGKVVIPSPYDRTPEIISRTLAVQLMFYYGSIPGNLATVTIRKAVFNDIGLFREDMRVSGDYEMWARLSDKYLIGFIHEPMIYLRRHIGQFSRARGIGVVFIREDQIVRELLKKRLPKEVLRYAKKYNRWMLHTQYVHYIFRCLLAGEVKAAAETYREIRNIDSFFIVVVLWLITVNGRFFKKKPKFIN